MQWSEQGDAQLCQLVHDQSALVGDRGYEALRLTVRYERMKESAPPTLWAMVGIVQSPPRSLKTVRFASKSGSGIYAGPARGRVNDVLSSAVIPGEKVQALLGQLAAGNALSVTAQWRDAPASTFTIETTGFAEQYRDFSKCAAAMSADDVRSF